MKRIYAAAVIVSMLACCSTAFSESEKSWYDDLIFTDKSYVFEFIRALGGTYAQGADIGECVATARRITDGDDESWYREWKSTADRIYGLARKWEGEGHVISAREAYLRASMYYRSASFYMDAPEDRPKAMAMWGKSRDSFLKGIASLPCIQPVKIPYEDTTLPGYFIEAEGVTGTAPLLIVNTGFDGTKEELFFEVGRAARKRGYHCLLFEGPGQGAALREEGLHFRYDWEKVVTPAVDYALTRPEVDPQRIALLGISLGGYLAPRAVSFEHRIAACIANGGVYNFFAASTRGQSPETIRMIAADPDRYDQEVLEAMKESPELRWVFNNALWTFGCKTPAAFMDRIREYTLEGVAGQIRCPMLVIDSEDDMFMAGQARQLYDALTCPKNYIVFTADEAAQAHCQEGANAISNEIIFNWLDGALHSPAVSSTAGGKNNAVILKNEMLLRHSPESYMEVRHIVLKGTNEEIGKALADIAREEYATTLVTYASPVYAQARLTYMEHNDPILLRRMKGVASSYDLDLATTDRDTSSLYYWKTAPECSALFIPARLSANGRNFYASNRDYYTASWSEVMGKPREPGEADFSSRVFVVELCPDKGYASLNVGSMDLLNINIDSVNAKGLSVAVLQDDTYGVDHSPADCSRMTGLTVYQLVRLIVDTCATVDEAKETILDNVAQMAPLPAHVMVMDASGRSFIYEKSSTDFSARFLDYDGTQPVPITNHSVYDYPSIDTFPQAAHDDYDTFNRFRRLRAYLDGHRGTYSYTDAAEAMSLVYGNAEEASEGGHHDLPLRTLYTALVDNDTRTIQVRFYLKDGPIDPVTGKPELIFSRTYDFGLIHEQR